MQGAGFYDSPVSSPDGKRLSYADNSWSLYWVDIETGISKRIASEPLYGPSRAKTTYQAWSPDSKWIVYTLNSKTYIQSIYAYSIEKGVSTRTTDGLNDVSEPAFDASGKYL